MRCMHEASMHEANTFLTLTYDDAHLPAKASLDREAFPIFIRALRKRGHKVRYFYVGEYGTNSERPHYHALLFGYRPSEQRKLAMRGEFPVYTSPEVAEIWTKGLHEFGDVSAQSALYVTGYMKRKITGSWAKARYGDREPEFGQMSRNPGIGAGWIDKFRCEVYPADGVVVRGSVVKPPRYYDLRSERVRPVDVEAARLKRFNARRRENESPERLEVMEKCAIAREDFNEWRPL